MAGRADPYRTLGISREAGAGEIRRAAEAHTIGLVAACRVRFVTLNEHMRRLLTGSYDRDRPDHDVLRPAELAPDVFVGNHPSSV